MMEQHRNRDQQIKARLNEVELAQFQIAVLDSGLSKQEYIRRAVLGQSIINTNGIRDLLPEMKHQGNNLNQIAKAINSNKHVPTQELEDTLREVREVWQLLRQYLQRLP